MATIYTDVGQNQADAASDLTGAADRAKGKNVGGDLLSAFARFTTTASTATGDVINVVKLPAGAAIIPALCRVYSEGSLFATSCTANLGLEQDPDLYASAIDINSASTNHDGIALDEEVLGEALTEVAAGGEWVQATLTAAGAVTADVDVAFLITYRVSR